MPIVFPPNVEVFISNQRTASLATAGHDGQPHLVPVCFVYDGATFYTVIDKKPKKVPPLQLRRIKNIIQNPYVALLLHHYDDEWDKLAYLMIRGTAEVLEGGQPHAIELLRDKYPQYRNMDLEAVPAIKITPDQFTAWGTLVSP